jgi:DNA modification methylase
MDAMINSQTFRGLMDYLDFIDSKNRKLEQSGFDVPSEWLHPSLFDYQEHIVRIALSKGRFAVFANTGLGKSLMQLAWANCVNRHTGKPVLILAPLGVARQTANTESVKWGIPVTYCLSGDDVTGGINVTNYERLGNFDASVFSGIVLDESSILKSFSGTIKQMLVEQFSRTEYRLCCSATPSPNDYTELGNHAEFLGVMLQSEMLATFFVRDGKANLAEELWSLKKYGKIKFWEWLTQWSCMLQSPADLGFSGDGFELPPLHQHEIQVKSNIKRDGELFTMEATGIQEQREAKRSTLELRVAEVAKLVNNSTEQWLVFCDLNTESEALKKAITGAVEVKGSDKEDHKSNSAIDFAEGHIRVLVSKPKIFGFGLNFQNCHNIIFVGLNNSFEAVYQSIRRCWRYGQQSPVNAYFICVDTEGRVLRNIKNKQSKFEKMQREITAHMKAVQEKKAMIGYNPEVKMTPKLFQAKENIKVLDECHGDDFNIFRGDSCEIIKAISDDSVDYSVFSPPFSNLFVYTDSDRDMGNVRSEEEFGQHYNYLSQNLFRIIKPGRLVSIHCQDLMATKAWDGYIGLKDFSCQIIRLMEKAGFEFHCRVTIWKDPVVLMQRTKSIMLLHKQLKKDSSISGAGLADYLITFRKPGINKVPIEGMLTEYHGENTPDFPSDPNIKSIEIWQRYASPVWMDIRQNDTLNFREGKDDDDLKHICPLQLDVVRRGLQLWSLPGEIVFSPFLGIGTEGYVSLEQKRKFIGIELKDSYFECAKQNLRLAEHQSKFEQLSLLELA